MFLNKNNYPVLFLILPFIVDPKQAFHNIYDMNLHCLHIYSSSYLI